jgi:hypothetical protein
MELNVMLPGQGAVAVNAAKRKRTSNSLFNEEENHALQVLMGVHVATTQDAEKTKAEKKTLATQRDAVKAQLNNFLKANNTTCAQFADDDGKNRYVRIVQKAAPKPVNPERFKEAMDKLDKNHIDEARAALIKRKDLEKSKKLAEVIVEAMEIVMRDVVKHSRPELEITASKEKGLRGEPLALPRELVEAAENFEKVKASISRLNTDCKTLTSTRKNLADKEQEFMPIIEKFMEKYADVKKHRIDLTAGEARQEMVLTRKEERKPAKWFSVKTAKPIVSECVQVIVPINLEFCEQTVSDFLANAEVKARLSEAIIAKMIAVREASKPVGVTRVKLEKAGKGRGPKKAPLLEVAAAHGEEVVDDEDNYSEGYYSSEEEA